MHELEVRAIGDEIALLLDEDALKLIGVSVGDSVLLLEHPDGLRLIPKDSEIGRAMVAAERVMKQYSGALKRLAES